MELSRGLLLCLERQVEHGRPAGQHEQALEPARTERGTHRYSADDLVRLHRISDLLAAGLNLAGIAMVLQLEAENDQLRRDR